MNNHRRVLFCRRYFMIQCWVTESVGLAGEFILCHTGSDLSRPVSFPTMPRIIFCANQQHRNNNHLNQLSTWRALVSLSRLRSKLRRWRMRARTRLIVWFQLQEEIVSPWTRQLQEKRSFKFITDKTFI